MTENTSERRCTSLPTSTWSDEIKKMELMNQSCKHSLDTLQYTTNNFHVWTPQAIENCSEEQLPLLCGQVCLCKNALGFHIALRSVSEGLSSSICSTLSNKAILPCFPWNLTLYCGQQRKRLKNTDASSSSIGCPPSVADNLRYICSRI